MWQQICHICRLFGVDSKMKKWIMGVLTLCILTSPSFNLVALSPWIFKIHRFASYSRIRLYTLNYKGTNTLHPFLSSNLIKFSLIWTPMVITIKCDGEFVTYRPHYSLMQIKKFFKSWCSTDRQRIIGRIFFFSNLVILLLFIS